MTTRFNITDYGAYGMTSYNPDANPANPVNVETDGVIQDQMQLNADFFAQQQDFFATQRQELSENFDQTVAEIREIGADNQVLFQDTIEGLIAGYEDQVIDTGEIVDNMRGVYEAQIGRIDNAYLAQVSREGERIDALVAGGSLGGSSYRAFQARSSVSRELMGQALSQIAQVSIDAEKSVASVQIEGARANAELYSSVVSSLAQLSSAYANNMLGYSQLLLQANIAETEAIGNLFALELGALETYNNFVLQTRSQDIQREVEYLNAQVQYDIANMNNSTKMFWNGVYGGMITGEGRYVGPDAQYSNMVREAYTRSQNSTRLGAL